MGGWGVRAAARGALDGFRAEAASLRWRRRAAAGSGGRRVMARVKETERNGTIFASLRCHAEEKTSYHHSDVAGFSPSIT